MCVCVEFKSGRGGERGAQQVLSVLSVLSEDGRLPPMTPVHGAGLGILRAAVTWQLLAKPVPDAIGRAIDQALALTLAC